MAVNHFLPLFEMALRYEKDVYFLCKLHLGTVESGHNKDLMCVYVYVFVHVAGVPVSPRPHEAICLWEVTLRCRNCPMAFRTV